jgi:hypothetical protein
MFKLYYEVIGDPEDPRLKWGTEEFLKEFKLRWVHKVLNDELGRRTLDLLYSGVINNADYKRTRMRHNRWLTDRNLHNALLLRRIEKVPRWDDRPIPLGQRSEEVLRITDQLNLPLRPGFGGPTKILPAKGSYEAVFGKRPRDEPIPKAIPKAPPNTKAGSYEAVFGKKPDH